MQDITCTNPSNMGRGNRKTCSIELVIIVGSSNEIELY